MLMNDRFQVKRIIWSIDAFEEKEDLQEKAVRVLSIFQHKIDALIEPVFVLGSAELSGPVDYTTDWMKEFEMNMRLHLEKVLLTSGFSRILSPKILVEPLAATSAAVEALLEYAAKQNADLIIVSSHGRRGLDRFFLGSFAETLLVHSKIPVLVIGAGTQQEPSFNRILFPTEFGIYAHEVFRRTVFAAKQMDASIMIYHVVPMPARIVMDTGYYPSLYGVEGEMVSREDFLKIQTEHQSRRAKAWAEWAKSEGVACSFKVESVEEAIDELICREAMTEKADLIMMEGQSGPIKVALLGSIARNVVRSAPCPVLIFPRTGLVENERELEKEREETDSGVFKREGVADKVSELRDFEI
ncbi:MAG: universal stress protein [Pseudobdellovibrionaceae bacterium]